MFWVYGTIILCLFCVMTCITICYETGWWLKNRYFNNLLRNSTSEIRLKPCGYFLFWVQFMKIDLGQGVEDSAGNGGVSFFICYWSGRGNHFTRPNGSIRLTCPTSQTAVAARWENRAKSSWWGNLLQWFPILPKRQNGRIIHIFICTSPWQASAPAKPGCGVFGTPFPAEVTSPRPKAAGPLPQGEVF
jgi:hypothetical protein